MKIGEVKLENPYILAPMAGVTDLPFRLLCKEQGAGLLCMEMISAKALQYKNKNTKTLLAIHPEEYPVSLQLFGSEPDIISEIGGGQFGADRPGHRRCASEDRGGHPLGERRRGCEHLQRQRIPQAALRRLLVAVVRQAARADRTGEAAAGISERQGVCGGHHLHLRCRAEEYREESCGAG